MASTSFKTPCPSCEAGVLVKDESLIGKKIDCPKCKYRFVVEAPNGKETAAPSKKPAAPGVKAKADAKAAPTKTKATARPPADDEDEAEDDKKDLLRKKKAGSKNKKMVLGLALAGLGVIVLVVGGFLILGNKGAPRKNQNVGVPRTDTPQNANQNPPVDEPKETKKPQKNTNPAKSDTTVTLAAAGPELTNLLPGQAQHVLHVFVKDALETTPLLGEALFQPRALGDDAFQQRLGFPLRAVDDLIRAENYANSWAFTVVHLKEEINKEALTAALGLEPAAGSPMNQQELFKVTKNRPWLEQLARFALGTLPPPAAKNEDRPLFVRIHDGQTLVFADAAPMQEFLARGTPAASGETYATLKPALRAMLDKLEKLAPESRDRVLLSAVTDLEAARMDAPPGQVRWRFRPLWDIAHALLDDPRRLRLLGASLVRQGKGDPVTYRYQNAVECAGDAEARTVEKDLRDKVAPVTARFLEVLLGQKVDVVPGEGGEPTPSPMTPVTPVRPRPPGPGSRPLPPGSRPALGPGSRPALGPGGSKPPRSPVAQPAVPSVKEPVKVDPDKSQITLANTDKTVVFAMNIVLRNKDLPRLSALADLIMVGWRGQLELASGISHRGDLALAEKRLGEQGIPDRGTPPAHYPRGVFPRKDGTPRLARDPGQRISWMAGLLPFLGHEALYTRIKFDASWKDPGNWMAARTLVPEFLDPTYPDQARWAPYPGIPFPLGGTNYVGIAGVGQDAPDYSASDPAVVAKLGVFGYERMTSLEEIRKNRGLSHTAVMVQVPYDGPAGVTPWMAGGGSTLRGVPEKDSVKPFVSTTKNGKRGTYLLMADGSVRFVGEDVKDEVFKAMCTIKGPADVAAFDRDAPAVEGSKQAASARKKDESKTNGQ